MSIEAMSWAFKLSLPPRDKFVLLALANYANDDGWAWPKQSTLAERTGYSRATINATLRDLEDEHGLIRSEERRYPDGRKASKRYRVGPSHVNEVDMESDEIDMDHVNGVDTDHVNEVDNKNLQHRTHNIEPKTTPPTPPRDPEPTRDGWGELQNETPLQELQRRLPEGFGHFDRICRTTRASYPVKIAQAEALNKAITEHGSVEVTTALSECLASIGDKNSPFGWIMTRLRNEGTSPGKPTRREKLLAEAQAELEVARKRREAHEQRVADRMNEIDRMVAGDDRALN